MSSVPQVTIVTPTKNRLALLCETMDSVQAQSLTTWEHLIVDDGSEDGTAEEVARRAHADPRIRYVRRAGQRGGANVCRNLGIHNSRADCLVFLDSDDLLEPTCLTRRVEVMSRNADLDFATFQTGVFKVAPGDLGRQLDGELLGDDLLRFLYFESPWQTSAPIWRRSALDRLGGFDEELLSWQDIDLHVRAIAQGLRYLRFPDVDHHFRWQFEDDKTSILQRCSPLHLAAATGVVKKLERVIRNGPGMNWGRQRALCSLYFFIAENWVLIGNLREASRTWGEVRVRSLGSSSLYFSGIALLAIKSLGDSRIGDRIAHKWKGWMRMRTNPEVATP